MDFHVPEELKEIRTAVEHAVSASGIAGVTVEGIDPMWFLRFADETRQDRFLRHAHAHGVLFKRGAYNYSSLAHDEAAVGAIERAASSAFVELVEEDSRSDGGGEV